MYVVKILVYFIIHVVDRDSSVGIASRHVLDGPGIETRERGGRIFHTRPVWLWGPPNILYNE